MLLHRSSSLPSHASFRVDRNVRATSWQKRRKETCSFGCYEIEHASEIVVSLHHQGCYLCCFGKLSGKPRHWRRRRRRRLSEQVVFDQSAAWPT